jgi:hypothetical protein
LTVTHDCSSTSRAWLRAWAAIAVGSTIAFASPCLAVDLESLISPGPLLEAHAREAKECAACHERFDQSSQNRLCLECHEDVRSDVEQRVGLHGDIRRAADTECRACHTEHKGEGADIVGLVAESFDHGRTDFALEGRHAALSCSGCHEAGARRRDAKSSCSACHSAADPHEGQLGDECASCHEPAGWRKVTFDHDTTKFPLEDRHLEAPCAACHPQQRFGKTATSCVSCHRVDDAHRGRLGPKCADCHTTAGWKRVGFDHGKQTRFALRGRHAKIECRTCHESEPEQVKLERKCVSCHRPDDDHRGLRGDRCERCHDARAWKPDSFDHARDAKYSLRGAHAKVACELCHTGKMYVDETPVRCGGCHASVDVHEGSLGDKCESCHGEKSWRDRVRFDHDLTSFPLLALHKLATCEDCHVSKRFGEAETGCAACHARADVHDGRLGQDCAVCHNPNGWDRWLFDHDRQTDFPLHGAHTDLACGDCHRSEPRTGSSKDGRYLDLSTRCRSCHLSDSPHDDAYGRDCERCHVDTSWTQIERR